jgi:hypothetical protein
LPFNFEASIGGPGGLNVSGLFASVTSFFASATTPLLLPLPAAVVEALLLLDPSLPPQPRRPAPTAAR